MSGSSFAHVRDIQIRRVLTRPAERILGPELARALSRTGLHIVKDSVNANIPPEFVDARAEAYVRGENALREGNLRAAHEALGQCWSV
jgi:hypothetical protein